MKVASPEDPFVCTDVVPLVMGVTVAVADEPAWPMFLREVGAFLAE